MPFYLEMSKNTTQQRDIYDIVIFRFLQISILMLNQGCCGSSQNNLIDRMLQVNAKTLNQKLFIFQFFGQHYILERGSVSPIYPFLA